MPKEALEINDPPLCVESHIPSVFCAAGLCGENNVLDKKCILFWCRQIEEKLLRLGCFQLTCFFYSSLMCSAVAPPFLCLNATFPVPASLMFWLQTRHYAKVLQLLKNVSVAFSPLVLAISGRYCQVHSRSVFDQNSFLPHLYLLCSGRPHTTHITVSQTVQCPSNFL